MDADSLRQSNFAFKLIQAKFRIRPIRSLDSHFTSYDSKQSQSIAYIVAPFSSNRSITQQSMDAADPYSTSVTN